MIPYDLKNLVRDKYSITFGSGISHRARVYISSRGILYSEGYNIGGLFSDADTRVGRPQSYDISRQIIDIILVRAHKPYEGDTPIL